MTLDARSTNLIAAIISANDQITHTAETFPEAIWVDFQLSDKMISVEIGVTVIGVSLEDPDRAFCGHDRVFATVQGAVKYVLSEMEGQR